MLLLLPLINHKKNFQNFNSSLFTRKKKFRLGSHSKLGFFLPLKQSILFARAKIVMPAIRMIMTTRITIPITGAFADSEKNKDFINKNNQQTNGILK